MSASIQLGIILFFPLLFVGIINKTKAFWAGRQGPSLYQPYYDFVKLFKKEQVISAIATGLFVWAPTLNVAMVISSACLTPILGRHAIVSFPFDFVCFAYLLSAGKFFQVLGALDTGSSFEGMGASREVTFHVVAEGIFFVLMAALSLGLGPLSLHQLHALFGAGPMGLTVVVMGSFILLVLMLLEGARVPFDDPATHLELTMVHEVMVLDNSGIDLALIQYASALKMMLYAALIAAMLLGPSLPLGVAFVVSLLIMSGIAVLAGTIESWLPRFRLSHIPQYLWVTLALGIMMFFIMLLSVNRSLG